MEKYFENNGLIGLDFRRILLLLVIAVGLWFGFRIVKPYADAVIIAAILAVLVNPLYGRLVTLLHGRRTVAALIVSIVVTICITVFFVAVVMKITIEVASAVQDTVSWVESGKIDTYLKDPSMMRISSWVNRYAAEINSLLAGTESEISSGRAKDFFISRLSTVPKKLLAYGGQIAGMGSALLLKSLVLFMMLLFMLRDQAYFRSVVYRHLPFTWGHEKSIDTKIGTLCRSTIFGIFITAIIQGFSVSIAFLIAGLPAVLGGVATAVAAFIPLIGTGLVWLPAVAFLMFSGQIEYAIFITVWWAVAVAPVDNFLRPILVGEGAEMSTPFVFLFILGGLHLFGFMGVIYGPLALGLLSLLFHLYGLELGLTDGDNEPAGSG